MLFVLAAACVQPPAPVWRDLALDDPAVTPYDPAAFVLRQPISADAAIDPRSADVIRRLDQNTEEGFVTLDDGQDNPSVYVVSDADPWYEVRTPWMDVVRFRVPEHAVNGGGADAPLELLDPLHPDLGPFVELRLWRASLRHTRQVVTAQGGGLVRYNNDGLLHDGASSVAQPFAGVGTGSGLSYLAGLIRPEEVEAGEIAHALRLAWSCRDMNSEVRLPALRTDQPHPACSARPSATPGSEKVAMGTRLQLDPAVDCEVRTVPGRGADSTEARFLRIVCRTLQEYGAVVLDGTVAGGLVVALEAGATADWGRLIGAKENGSYGYILRDQGSPDGGRGPQDGVPWARMRVLAP